jgi:hypothetical protein
MVVKIKRGGKCHGDEIFFALFYRVIFYITLLLRIDWECGGIRYRNVPG